MESEALIRLQGSSARFTEAIETATAAVDAWIREEVRWRVEFCLTATDEEIAEADRLFGTPALVELRRELAS